MISGEKQVEGERPQWRFHEVQIRHVREVPSADVVEIIEELSHDFATVKTTRWNFIPGAGGPGYLEAAVVIMIVGGYTVAHSFLQELGKDAYRTVRAAIHRLYRQRGSFVTPHGGYLPLELSVREKRATLRFIFDEGLPPGELDELLLGLGSFCHEVLAHLPPEDDGKTIQFKYDQEKRMWIPFFEMKLPGNEV